MLDPVTAVIIGALISGGIGGFGLWLKGRKAKSETERIAYSNTRKQVWRLEKAVLILVKLLDKQTAKVHPELEADLTEIIDEILEAEYTNGST